MTKPRTLNENELDALRESVEGSIRKAFAHCRRTGGVSWSEADVIDDHGSAEQREAARRRDKDTHWEQLIDDTRWDAHNGSANFTFLDPVGKRYYLPAIMIRAIRDREALDLVYSLAGAAEALNDAQMLAVAHYIHFMWQRSLADERRSADELGRTTSVISDEWRQLFDHWNKWCLKAPYP